MQAHTLTQKSLVTESSDRSNKKDNFAIIDTPWLNLMPYRIFDHVD